MHQFPISKDLFHSVSNDIKSNNQRKNNEHRERDKKTYKSVQLLLFYTKITRWKREEPGKIAKFPKLGKVKNYNPTTVVTIKLTPRYRSRWSVGNTVRRGSRKISLFRMFSLHLFAPTRANKNQPSKKTIRPVKIFRVQALWKHTDRREREWRKTREVG